jgi:hypothetical protein
MNALIHGQTADSDLVTAGEIILRSIEPFPSDYSHEPDLSADRLDQVAIKGPSITLTNANGNNPLVGTETTFELGPEGTIIIVTTEDSHWGIWMKQVGQNVVGMAPWGNDPIVILKGWDNTHVRIHEFAHKCVERDLGTTVAVSRYSNYTDYYEALADYRVNRLENPQMAGQYSARLYALRKQMMLDLDSR